MSTTLTHERTLVNKQPHTLYRLLDFMRHTLLAPSESTVDKEWRKHRVFLLPGFQEHNFKVVGQIYTDLKETLGISGHVPYELSEGEGIEVACRCMCVTESSVVFLTAAAKIHAVDGVRAVVLSIIAHRRNMHHPHPRLRAVHRRGSGVLWAWLHEGQPHMLRELLSRCDKRR